PPAGRAARRRAGHHHRGADPGRGPSPPQGGFRACPAVQCGFCTPGMIVASTELLTATPAPDEAEIREALAGNLCMCTGYVNIVRAVTAASRAGARKRAR